MKNKRHLWIILATVLILGFGVQLVAMNSTSTALPSEAEILSNTGKDGKPRTFEEVLSDYKGKVVYVDVWASWCGPCRKEMPNSAALKQQIANEEVVFLYVSLDQSKKAFMNAVQNLEIKGKHFWPLPKSAEAMMASYRIEGIPRYMIVAKDGKIVDKDAPRPSEKRTLKILQEELLK